MNMNTITCNKCGNTIEVSQALEDEVRKKIELQVQTESKKNIQLKEKELTEKIRQEIAEKTSKDLKDLQKQLEEKNEKVEKLQEFELKLREEKRALEEKEKDLKLEVARRIDVEKKKVEEMVLKRSDEEHRLKDLEKEKMIKDLQQSLDDARRKAHQGSQQLQGEVQELDLEQTLRTAFHFDTIEPVGKGVKGADVRQIVKTQLGNVCGVILWESKQTKAWSNEWISKLKNDVRAEKAHIPVIVSTQLPDEAKNGFGFKEGVYIVSPELSLPIAEILRQKLIDIAREKFVLSNKGGKADDLYAYVTGYEFRQHIEAIIESYQDMQKDLLREKAAMEKIWKTRETQITKLFTGTARIIGSMRGVIGSSLPSVRGLELEDGNQQEDNT
jgi:hypothetical protein